MDSAASLPRIRKHGGGGDGERDRHGGSREFHSRDDRRGDRRDDRRDRDGGHNNDRRRSRSPHHRSGRHEQDSYASSRDHRAQEREERYSRRDPRRGDRDWDRDRGGQNRRRRDDDRFGGRDDRRGGGRRGEDRAERDEFAQQRGARARSKSPNKKREPTPDLTDVVSVLDRKRRLTQWDIKPPGYENVTAEQAKLSGMFPLPGAPRQQAVDPSKLQSLISQPGGASQATLKPSNARQSKRLFVGNLPSSATDESVIEFFNLQLNGLNVIETTDPCISCQITANRESALIEFKNPAEATMALTLDGTYMNAQATNGAASQTPPLSIRRPKDYIVAGAAEDDAPMEGDVSATVPDTPNKLSISNILPNLDEDQIKELVSTFGALRAFTLVKENSTGESRGIVFLEYADPKVTDMAVEGLNGMEVGGKALRVQHASVGVSQASGLEMSVNAMSMLAGTTSDNLDEGRVLQLLNMVTAEELIDQGEYDEIVEDVREECEKYGRILEIKVPRPTMGSRQSAGVGKIFIKYDTPESAKRALQDLAGRKFADRTVISTYFSEESFDVNAW